GLDELEPHHVREAGGEAAARTGIAGDEQEPAGREAELHVGAVTGRARREEGRRQEDERRREAEEGPAEARRERHARVARAVLGRGGDRGGGYGRLGRRRLHALTLRLRARSRQPPPGA